MRNVKILFVAPSSYPICGAEANVNAKMLKLLSEAGYTIDLVGRAPRKFFEFYPRSNNDFFFSRLNSIHTISVDTAIDLKTIFRHIHTLLKTGYVYKGSDWAIEAITLCEKLIQTNKYDFIFTYDYPSELVGYYLSKKYSIKWVSVWNDPYIWEKYPAPYGEGADKKITYIHERLIANMCKQLYRSVFPSDRLRDYMLGYMTNMKREICVISPHILLDQLISENEKPLGDILKIIHSGALGKERNPKTFIEGFRLFLNKYPDAKIEFSFLGIFLQDKNNYFNDLIHKYGLNNYIKFLGRVEYTESLRIVKNYDVCMLIEAACEEGIFLPSKISDYMQNSKPILALSPQNGVIHDMYKRNEIDYFADVTQPEQIADSIECMYQDFESVSVGNADKCYDRYRNNTIINIYQTQIFNY